MQMIGRKLASPIVFCAFISAAANAAVPNGLVGKGYDEARAKLVRAGFEPVHFQRGPLYQPCPDDPASCKPYPETISCSGTGLAYCQFAFADARRRYIIVTTQGEERRGVVSVVAASRRDKMGWPHERH
jgi:hypothetical protein